MHTRVKAGLGACAVDMPGRDMIIQAASIEPGQCPYHMHICPGISPQIALIAAKSKAKRLHSILIATTVLIGQGALKHKRNLFLSRSESSVHHITYTRYRELAWLIYFHMYFYRKTPRTHYLPQEPRCQGIIASRATAWTLFLVCGKLSGTCTKRVTLSMRPG